MINVDKFLDRVPTQGYNCFDFVREVWLDWTGEDLTEKLKGLQGAFAKRRASISGVKAFTEIKEPSQLCFVVMQRKFCVPHVGIYVGFNLFHLSDAGARLESLKVAKRYFRVIRFYQ